MGQDHGKTHKAAFAIPKGKKMEHHAKVKSSYLTDTRLSGDACKVANYLAAQRQGYILNQAWLQGHLGMGRDKMGRACAELRKLGYLKASKPEHASGRLRQRGSKLTPDTVTLVSSITVPPAETSQNPRSYSYTGYRGSCIQGDITIISALEDSTKCSSESPANSHTTRPQVSYELTHSDPQSESPPNPLDPQSESPADPPVGYELTQTNIPRPISKVEPISQRESPDGPESTGMTLHQPPGEAREGAGPSDNPDIARQVTTAATEHELTNVWRKHKDHWTQDLSKLASDRRAQLQAAPEVILRELEAANSKEQLMDVWKRHRHQWSNDLSKLAAERQKYLTTE